MAYSAGQSFAFPFTNSCNINPYIHAGGLSGRTELGKVQGFPEEGCERERGGHHLESAKMAGIRNPSGRADVSTHAPRNPDAEVYAIFQAPKTFEAGNKEN